MLNQEIYTPPAEIASKAHVKSLDQYKEMYKKSLEDPVAFWTPILETFTWKNADFSDLRHFNFDTRKGAVETRWFPKAETNICFNAVDRHVEAGHGDRIAFFYEGNDVDDQHEAITYAQLLERVHRMANVLKKHGVKRGDRVAVYMPMVLELPIAMLACARIGAIHSVVFGGFSADSLADRIMDSTCKVVITADGVMRGTKRIDLKAITDAAVEHCLAEKSPIDAVLVLERLGSDKCPVTMHQCRDYWLGKEMAAVDAECPVTWMNVEDPLFILYTSGSTGKPKGVQHSTGGYMVYTATTFKYIFDYHEGDVFWCTADCGWITGHSYITYGPMLNGATQVLFEGVPTHPDSGRFWAVVDKYKVTQFYTAPTAIRALMSTGDAHVTKYSRKSLRILGTVGEPINPKAWLWYHRVVGDGRCPIVDTFWQTETGGIVITPLPGATPLKPGSATFPFFGVQPVVLDEEGHEIEGACSGYLAMKTAWPSIMRTVYGDHERFEKTYFTQFKGYYSTGDGCRRDEDGYFWITGRVDDVLNVAGHRLGTAEIESALVHHAKCAEASVVAAPHEIKGQCIYAFVTLMQGVEPSSDVRRELKEQVRREIGPFATPEVIHWASALPKTRSGKIMRRILRKIAEKGKSATEEDFGDTTTLADQSVVEKLMDAIGK